MLAARLLQELARQVRERTRQILLAAPEQALLWAPTGTQNHILWHAGHAVWLMDVLGIALLTGRRSLEPHWDQLFGMHCQPPRQTRNWPTREEIDRRLNEQLHHYLLLLEQAPAEQFDLPVSPAQARHSLSGRLLHGLHDEACHSGEMYLLLKQWHRQRH
ncbi:MAG: DinB family protein [Gemmataceae bacterium]|nr:DinB family protein [Gemmataceae bacterium]MCS7271096.1 DinB family protein [Gemmataceae bacterium]MDW8242621.1 DinB family protein [Thermogemmata sp.]